MSGYVLMLLLSSSEEYQKKPLSKILQKTVDKTLLEYYHG